MADIDRLTVVWDANFKQLDDKLNKVIRSNYSAAKKVEDAWGKVKPSGAFKFGEAVGAGLNDIAQSAGNAASTLPGAGAALAALGPAGLIAAAGIGAVIAAFAGARQAAAFADDIADTADRLHITTDALQEYRFAIHAAGGETGDADKAIEAFSETLGAAAAGAPKALKSFQQLFGTAFSKEDVRNLGSVEEALRAVQAQIQGLSATEQDAVLKRLGLSEMKQLLDESTAKFEETIAAAKALGYVMDADIVKRGAAMNDEFEQLAHIIDVQVKSALIDLGPELLKLIGWMADLAKGAAEVVDRFRKMPNQSTMTLFKRRQAFADVLEDPVRSRIPGMAANARQKMAEIDAEIEKDAQARWAAEDARDTPPTRHLEDVFSKAGDKPKAERDTTEQRTQEVTERIAEAQRNRLRAEAELTDNVEARAELERQMAAEQLKSDLARLEGQRAKILSDKGMEPAEREAQAKRLNAARTAIKEAAFAEQVLRDRQARWAAEDRADETRRAIHDAEIQQLEASAALATTAKERTKIEREILRLKQNEAVHETGKDLSRLTETDAISQDEAGRRSEAARQGREAERATFDGSHQTAIQNYMRSLEDLDTIMQEAGVSAAKNLADGLADAIVSANSLGDVASSVFRQLITQLISASIQKSFIGPIMASFGIPAYAGGTKGHPGGLAMVGEKGPELLRLPAGSQVIPNAAMRSVSAAGGDPTIRQTINFDNRGSIIWEAAARSMMSYADRASARAGIGAVDYSRKSTPSDLGRAANRRLGR